MTDSEKDHQRKVDHYNRIKYQNFVASSRLEGIHLPPHPPSATIDEVISKYKRPGNEEPT